MGESRQKLITLAKLAEQAERYEDMSGFMKNAIIEHGPNSENSEERNLLSVAYKNVVGGLRTAYRIVAAAKVRKSESTEICENYLATLVVKLKDICSEVIDLLDNHLIKEESEKDVKSEEVEAHVFYLKMKADYFRYLAEVEVGDDRKKSMESAKSAYISAHKTASTLESTNPIRLGLALNFSVFYYEICMEQEKACQLAKAAFDDAIAQLDQLKEDSYKDSTLIMQLLRDNLTLWTSNPDGNNDQVDEEEAEPTS